MFGGGYIRRECAGEIYGFPHFDMHHLVGEINFVIHFVSLIK